VVQIMTSYIYRAVFVVSLVFAGAVYGNENTNKPDFYDLMPGSIFPLEIPPRQWERTFFPYAYFQETLPKGSIIKVTNEYTISVHKKSGIIHHVSVKRPIEFADCSTERERLISDIEGIGFIRTSKVDVLSNEVAFKGNTIVKIACKTRRIEGGQESAPLLEIELINREEHRKYEEVMQSLSH